MKVYSKLLLMLVVLLFTSFLSLSYYASANAASKQQVIKISGKMALHYDHSVWVWGDNPYVSDGSDYYPKGVSQPVKVKELSDVVDIDDTGTYSVALKKDGTVWIWGSGQNGTLGNGQSMLTLNLTPSNGPKPYSQKPLKVKNLSDIIAISAGSHVLALKKDGTVWSWGQNGGGQAGIGTDSLEITIPTKVVGLPAIQSIATGSFHSLALDTTGEVWMWGSNYYGKAGDGSESKLAYNGNSNMDLGPSQHKYVPVKVKGLSNVERIQAVSGWYNIAIKKDGSTWFWGKNNILSFSHDETLNQLLPKIVPELRSVQDIVSDYYSSMILKKDGSLWTLGYNRFGQLGIGNRTDHMEPIQVKALSDIIGITNDGESSFALKKDGSVWAWGKNNNGQLGNRNRYLFITPRQIIFNNETRVIERPIEVFVDDSLLTFKTPPKMINKNLYIPSAELSKQLGYTATAQGKSKQIINKGKQSLIIENGSKKVLINNKAVTLDKPVLIHNNQFWLPSSSIKTLFKVKLYYEKENNIIAITTK